MNFNHSLHILPEKTTDAFAQMAEDLLHLESYPHPQVIRLRHYSWAYPAFTFGYSQQYEWVKKQIPSPMAAFDVCRRPTGGGVVDHRYDFTYSLILPPQHLLYREPPQKFYRLVHESIASSLLKNGQEAQLQECPNDTNCKGGFSSSNNLPTICFQRKEIYDLVDPLSKQKIAGAALKRNRFGLLLQGSIEKAVAANIFSWETFFVDFIEVLQKKFHVDALRVDYPQYEPETATFLRQKLSSQRWNQRR